jgi:ABC-type multidrug transport system fused ATPase/permease subunit
MGRCRPFLEDFCGSVTCELGYFTRTMGYIAQYWYILVLVVALMVGNNLIQLIEPQITADIINSIQDWLTDPVGTPAQTILDRLPLAGFIIVSSIAITALLEYVQRYTVQYIGQKAVFNLRNDLFQSLQEKSFSFYDAAQTGQLMSRVTHDVRSMQRMMSLWFTSFANIFISYLAVLGLLLSIDYRLTLLSLIPAPFVLLISYRYNRVARPLHREQRYKLGDMEAFLQQNITGIRVVRTFTQEGREIEKYAVKNHEYMDLNLKTIRYRALYPNLNDVFYSLATVALYWYGGNFLLGHLISLGDLLLFTRMMMRLMQPLRFVSMLTGMYTSAMAGAERVFGIMDQVPDVQDRPDAIPLPPLKGEVVFEDVSFEYLPGKPVLEHINLIVAPGETVAILGATGSGKSTLIYLVPRFYDVTAGRILIDGHDVRDVTLRSLRQQIGISLQEVFLFSTTIRENIAYGRPDTPLDAIIAVAKAAQAHDFIMSFPAGYDTFVGERGVTLSGGQKQRIAIARALLMDPKILIMDASTSFVDTETESRIQTALDALFQNRTTLVITQRLSTIKTAHRIIVLKDGQIGEAGTHDELLAKNGIYTRIYRTQFAEEDLVLPEALQRAGGGS